REVRRRGRVAARGRAQQCERMRRITREELSDEKQTFGQHRSAVGRNGHGVGAERTKRRTRFRPRRPKPGCTGRRGGTGSTGSAGTAKTRREGSGTAGSERSNAAGPAEGPGPKPQPDPAKPEARAVAATSTGSTGSSARPGCAR